MVTGPKFRVTETLNTWYRLLLPSNITTFLSFPIPFGKKKTKTKKQLNVPDQIGF